MSKKYVYIRVCLYKSGGREKCVSPCMTNDKTWNEKDGLLESPQQ